VGGGVLLVGGILAVSFNMRGAITSLPPIFPELSVAAGLSPATEAALGAVPVLSFAVFSGFGAAAARRLGEERVLGLALVLVAVGLALRSLAPGAALFPGTVIACGAIALLNVLLPSLIKRRRPAQAGLLIGLYLMSLTAGAVVGAVIAVPVFTAAGGSGAAVRLCLGIWALPALLAAVVWSPQLRFRTFAADAAGVRPVAGESAGASVLADPAGIAAGSDPVPLIGPARRFGVLEMSRHALAWQVTAFMGLQSLSYYATLSWFPTLLRDHGSSAVRAGDLLALMNVGNAVTALIVPVIAHRVRDQRLIAAAAVLAIIAGLAGTGFGPAGTAVEFVCLLGLGQGAALGLSVFFFTARTADSSAAASLSGFAQSVGYLVAAAGPLAIGFLHAATGGWAVPVWVLIGVGGAQLVAGLLAGRDLTISAGRQPLGVAVSSAR